MRIVIDALGAPAQSGGMRVHAEELIRAWSETFPGDRLVVLGYDWVRESFRDTANVLPITVHGAMSRYAGQLITSARVFRKHNADALLSLSTVVSPLVPSWRTACFIHDWRHKLNSREFGLAQRVYRKLWELSIRWAGTTFAISEKTRRETLRFARPRALIVAENGGDHPRRWGVTRGPGNGLPQVLTFGHFPSKRPELVIDAIAALKRVGRECRVVVLGARGDYQAQLRERAVARGVEDLVDLPGFVSDDELYRLVSSSEVLALVSSDEGYGMPVVEGAFFGVPTVVTDDSGLAEIHGDRVIEATASAYAVADAIVTALAPLSRPTTRTVQTWSTTVANVREALVSACERGERG